MEEKPLHERKDTYFPSVEVAQVVCDIGMENGDVHRVWQELLEPYQGICSLEYQVELRSSLDDFEQIPRFNLKKDGYIGVHQPTSQLDIISAEYGERSLALNLAKKGLELAHHLGADYYVVHPTTSDNWVDRGGQQRQAHQWIFELYNYGKLKKLTPRICVENLEYPKYPATLEELLYLLSYLSSEGMDDVGLIFDVAHHWHNYVHLLHQISPTLLVSSNQYGKLLEDHLSQISTRFPNKLFGYHLAQGYIEWEFDQHVTHGLPGLFHSELGIGTGVKPTNSGVEWLDLEEILRALCTQAQANGEESVKILLEVHHQPPEKLIEIAHAIIAYWAQLEDGYAK